LSAESKQSEIIELGLGKGAKFGLTKKAGMIWQIYELYVRIRSGGSAADSIRRHIFRVITSSENLCIRHQDNLRRGRPSRDIDSVNENSTMITDE
jgi:hypothetical protein